jgi:hypothetical protein
MIPTLVELRATTSDGSLPLYAWPGGYPIVYYAEDMGTLCAKCANEYTPERDNEHQLMPMYFDINWEDEELYCEHCGARCECAYPSDKTDLGSSTRESAGEGHMGTVLP